MIELQSKFGGGYAPSLLAPYHLFSGATAVELAVVEDILNAEKLSIPKKGSGWWARRSDPRQKGRHASAHRVGEIAWQLGESAGSEGYALLVNPDGTAISRV